MNATQSAKNIEQKMHKALDAFKNELGKIRTGRAHVGILEHIQIDYYGSMTPITQVASLGVADARTLTAQPWEKNMVSVIEKAIREADLGLNPAAQGDLIRIPMPPLTEERRRELVKVVKAEGEQARVAIRNIRRDANDDLKKSVKEKLISEDDERRSQDEIQKLTDKFIAEADKLIIEKEKEIMTV